MQQLLAFLQRLREAKVPLSLSSWRDEAVMVEFALPGERWEVEFMMDNSIEVEVFRSEGEISGPEKLDEFFQRWSSDDATEEGR